MTPQTIRKLSRLKYIFLAGEVLSPLVVNQFRELNSSILLENLYGPTEGTIYASSYSLVDGKGVSPIPIGKPLENIKLYVVNTYGNLHPMGVPGELCIGGVGVARGYLNRPELTAEKFCQDLWDYQDNQDGYNMSYKSYRSYIIYKTGDLARWLYNGEIEFLGRVDHQVKIRGYRVELGEIENQLLKHEAVKEAVVLAREEEGGDKYLCAYIVGEFAFKGANVPSELKRYLSQSLPDYMIPTYVMELPELPLTASGKIDRQVLPAPVGQRHGVYAGPRDSIEMRLVRIWGDVLPSRPGVTIGIDDNFFELGGHSLKATVMVSRIHKVLNVKLTLAQVFKTPTIRGLSGYIKRAARDKYAAIEPVEKQEYYVLSSAQKRLYILQQMEQGSTAYNMPSVIPLSEEPEINQLKEIFIQLIQRHESFRTSFHMAADQPVQKVHEGVAFSIDYYDTEGTRGLAPLPIKNFVRPFDLTQAPLLRVAVIKLADSRCLLMVDMHHIISDGISHEILAKDFAALYLGETLSPLHLQYKDFARWQNSAEVTEMIKQQEDYWLKEFTGEIPVLNIPIDYPRPVIQRFEGGLVRTEITPEHTVLLQQYAREEGVTLYMLVLAITNVLLSRLSNQEDIVIGTPTGGRRYTDLEKIVGMFVNTLAMRNYPGGEKSFAEFLAHVKERALEAFENQEYQFEDLVDRVKIKRDTSRNPLFDIMFAFQDMDIEATDTSRAAASAAEIPTSQKDWPFLIKSKFDMTITAGVSRQNLSITFNYSSALFKKETIETFAAYFKNIVSIVILQKDIKLFQIEILSAEEKRQLVYDFNDTEAEFPKDKTLHQLFEEQVEQKPHQVAVVFNDERLTYRKLYSSAHRLAYTLRGAVSDSIVGLMVDRSLEMIWGMIAVLKAGSAYMPIDSQYPWERIRYMMEDSKARILITSPELFKENSKTARWEEMNNIEIVPLNSSSLPHFLSSSLPGFPASHSSRLAYVIYTSGTTGNPKAVMIEHKSVINLVMGLKDRVYPGSAALPLHVSLLSPYVFDASIKQIFFSLLLGHVLVIVPEEARFDGERLYRYYKEKEIQVSDGTPAHLSMMLDYHWLLAKDFPLQQLVIGGEQLDLNLCRRLIKVSAHRDDFRLINVYGPTECCDVSTWYQVLPGTVKGVRRIPIGKPLANVKTYILGSYRQLQAVGVAGELYIAGEGLARGVLNRVAETWEKFIIAPLLHGLAPCRLYRTGDLVRWQTDGNIEFLGRIDQQVKLRGFRIELGEIEHCLSRHPQVKEAVVLAPEDQGGERYICAYVVTDFAEPTSISTELTGYLSHWLPGYMIPTHFIPIREVPLTPNGKVNRKALPEPTFASQNQYIAPRDEIEEKLVEIWSEVLGRDPSQAPIGIDDNFFTLGGHSLRAIIMTAKVHQALDVNVSLAEVFKNPTIKGISAYINRAARDPFVSIEPTEKKEYYVLSPAQKRMYILEQTDVESTAYNMSLVVELSEETDIEQLEVTFRQLIERHESLRTSIELIKGHPVQRIHPEVAFNIEHYETTGEIKRIIREFVRPFDLAEAPLLRVGVLKRSRGNDILMMDMHHMISDGLSRRVLTDDFVGLTRGAGLPELRVHYKDYAEWQNRPQQQEVLEQQEKYWLKEFSGEIPLLKLPIDFPRPKQRSFKGSYFRFEIESQVTRELKKYAQEQGTTLYMILLAVITAFLSKLSGQTDIVVGTPVAGRRHADLEKVIGLFVNTLPLRNFPGEEKTFTGFLQDVKIRTLRAFQNQDYPFDDLVEKVVHHWDMSHNPLFDVMFSYQNLITDLDEDTENTGESPSSPELENLPGYENNTSKFDLGVNITVGERLFVSFTYSTELFMRETIELFSSYFREILSSVTTGKNLRLKDIKILHGFKDVRSSTLLEDLTELEF
jgi:amino acid adenylation domain-containing protein